VLKLLGLLVTFSTQDQAAAAGRCRNSSLRLERLNEVDFDWCIEQTLFFGEDRAIEHDS
jgi:adenosylhomocysteinase